MLSSEQDSFFKANMYENFGDIGMNIKRLVDEFQHVAKSNQNIQTIGLCFKFFNGRVKCLLPLVVVCIKHSCVAYDSLIS